MLKPMLRSDDAVSVSLGFIILIGILLTSVAIIFVMGFPIYNNFVDQSHMQNMIEGFDLVSENANNVALLRTPYQQSELKLYDGTISLRDAGTMRVDCYHNADGSDPAASNIITLNTLEYSKGDSSIAYLLGGVFKNDTYTYPVIKKPLIYTYNKVDGTPVLVMPLVSLYDAQFSLAGDTLARISFGTLYSSKKSQIVSQPDVQTHEYIKLIRITLESDYNGCLSTYFRDDWGFETVQDDGHTLVMEKPYDTPGTGITVNIHQSIVVATINQGSV